MRDARREPSLERSKVRYTCEDAVARWAFPSRGVLYVIMREQPRFGSRRQ